MISESVLNRLIYDKGFVTTEVRATLPGCRRWVAIYPASNHSPVDKTIPDHLYSVLDFELTEGLMDKYFGEEDKLNQRRYYLNSLDEVNNLLNQLGLSQAQFTYPWRCDYPL
ncbi:hypothetical protein ACAW74_26165 [Fibrella sp. WM1]|uniref:hypothetical protein n=1 Tax=Fibrella musci TaxID=3242485 RepID=UPI0035219283